MNGDLVSRLILGIIGDSIWLLGVINPLNPPPSRVDFESWDMHRQTQSLSHSHDSTSIRRFCQGPSDLDDTLRILLRNSHFQVSTLQRPVVGLAVWEGV